MIIALVTTLFIVFFGVSGPGGADPFDAYLERCQKAISKVVPDEQRRERVQQLVKDARDSREAKLSDLVEVRQAFFAVDARYDAKSEDYAQHIDAIDDAFGQSFDGIVQLRFQAKEELLESEWQQLAEAVEDDTVKDFQKIYAAWEKLQEERIEKARQEALAGD